MIGSKVIGTQVIVNKVIGTQVIGTEVIGTEAIGAQALGHKAIGSKVLGGVLSCCVAVLRGPVAGPGEGLLPDPDPRDQVGAEGGPLGPRGRVRLRRVQRLPAGQ